MSEPRDDSRNMGLESRAHWSAAEIAFWLAAVATVFLLPSRYLILTEIAWLGLFVISLDLILGYAGILSLGQAAFFGVGAYAAGLLAKHGFVTEPVLALVVSGAAAALVGFVTSFLVLRGSDLTRLMVTLAVALVLRELANRFSDITGGSDGLQGIVIGPVLGLFDFDIFGKVAYIYCLVVLFVMFVAARRIVNSPFGLSLRAVRNNPLRAAAVGIAVNRRLVAVFTLAAFYAGVAGALATQTTAFASLDVFSFDRSADLLLVLIIGGIGYLYGGLIGAIAFKLGQDFIATLTPQYWHFWIGLMLVLMVMFGRIYGLAMSAVVVWMLWAWVKLGAPYAYLHIAAGVAIIGAIIVFRPRLDALARNSRFPFVRKLMEG